MSDETKKYWTEDDELVSQYVLGQFSKETMRQMELEIEECAPCKAKLKQEMELAAGMRRHGRDLKKATLRTKLRRARDTQFNANHFVGMAAAILIVVLAVGAYTVWLGDLKAPTSFGEREVVLRQDAPDAETDALQELPEENPDAPVTDNTETPEAKQSTEETNASETTKERTSSPEHTTLTDGTPIQDRTARTEQKTESAVASKASTSERPAERSVAANEPNGGVGIAGKSVAASRVPPSPFVANSAMADAAPSAAEGSIPGNSKAIWLIGKVVMVSGQKSVAQNGLAKEHNLARAAQGRRPADAGIVLQQRPIKELPQGLLQRKRSAEVSVQTMMERTEEGVSLTLYGDAVSGEELQNAVVETYSDDSLVVSLPNHRLSFRLPEGWGNTQSKR